MNESAPSRTQIILLMTDTQRRDMLSCYGRPWAYTPNIDRLAKGGWRFDRAYSCQPVFGPARSALFTGTWPYSNGSWANNAPLGDTIRTIGQYLSGQGICCGYIGKWHLDGSDYFGNGRCPKGWNPDYWYDMRNYLEELTPKERQLSRQWTSNAAGVPSEFTYAHRCTDRALKFLDDHRFRDFLLVVSYDEPHDPYLAPEPFASMFRDNKGGYETNSDTSPEGLPEHQRIWARDSGETPAGMEALAEFFGCNAFVDSQIGRLLDKADDVVPDRMVIYTSDHGDFLGAHGLSGKGPAMYEEITNIPLVFSWAGRINEGIIDRKPISHIDITPTILDAFGIPEPGVMEGHSILNELTSDDRISKPVFIEFGRYEVDHDGFGGFQPIRCIIEGSYKLVINLMTSDELYDLENDPDEQTNLIHHPAYSDIRERLHDRLIDWMNDTRDPFRGYYWRERPWRKDTGGPSWRFTGMTRQRDNEPFEPRQLDYATGLEIVEHVRPK